MSDYLKRLAEALKKRDPSKPDTRVKSDGSVPRLAELLASPIDPNSATLTPASIQKMREGSALEGELGGIGHPGGGVSHEVSITEYVPELGGWANMPSLVQGQVDVPSILKTNRLTDEQYRIAIERAIQRKAMGQSLPAYESRFDAENEAWRRHMAFDVFPKPR